jgi:hypothetical protein
MCFVVETIHVLNYHKRKRGKALASPRVAAATSPSGPGESRIEGDQLAPPAPVSTGPNSSHFSPLNFSICICLMGAKSVGLV